MLADLISSPLFFLFLQHNTHIAHLYSSTPYTHLFLTCFNSFLVDKSLYLLFSHFLSSQRAGLWQNWSTYVSSMMKRLQAKLWGTLSQIYRNQIEGGGEWPWWGSDLDHIQMSDSLSVSKIRNQLLTFSLRLLSLFWFISLSSHTHVLTCVWAFPCWWFAHIFSCRQRWSQDKLLIVPRRHADDFTVIASRGAFHIMWNTANQNGWFAVIYSTKHRGTVNNGSERPWNESLCLTT